MSLFFGKTEQRAMASWAPVDPALRRVTPETATHLVPVFSAIRHIVDFCSTLPVDAYRKAGPDRIRTPYPALISGTNLEGRPGLVSWLGQAFYAIVTRGNAVGWINETDGFGFPTSVSWLSPGDWSFDEQSKQWYAFGIQVGSSNILHIPWIVPPGKVLGLSPIEHFATTIGAGLSAQEYSDIKRGGGNPPSILKNTQKVLEPGAADVIRERLRASMAKGDPFVAGADWDWEAVTIPPNHTQFIETLRLTAVQTAAIYGIDPTEIGGPPPGGSLTYSTEESRQIRRASDMRPYIERFERALSRALPPGQFIKLNTDATVRADLKTRTEVVGQRLKDGRMSVNEARALEDLSRITGGDVYNIPTVAQRDVAETIQKVYLGVDKVITADEARAIANKAGAGLTIPGPFKVPGNPEGEPS